MVLKPDQERVRTLLKDTITLLCRNGLSFNAKFCIDAVIGVTLDDRELFYMSMNEVIKSEKSLLRGEPPESSEEDDEMSEQSGKRPGGKEPRKRHRNKRPRVKREGDTSSDDENGQRDDNDATSYTGEMSNYHGEGGDDTGTNQQSSILMGVKREADKSEEEDDNNDIVFIKEELDDSWPPSGSNNTTTNQGAFYHGLPGSSNQDSMYQAQDNSQDPSFGSLSDMNLVPVGSQEGAVMWAQSGSYQGAGRGRGRGRSPGASSSSQDLQPGMDQQASMVHSVDGQLQANEVEVYIRKIILLHPGIFVCNRSVKKLSDIKAKPFLQEKLSKTLYGMEAHRLGIRLITSKRSPFFVKKFPLTKAQLLPYGITEEQYTAACTQVDMLLSPLQRQQFQEAYNAYVGGTNAMKGMI